MPGMVRFGRGLASFLVVASVLTSAWATCAEGATSTALQQMACCKGGHHHCPMKDSASDCCKLSPSHVESHATIVKAESMNAAAPVLLTWAIIQPAAVAEPQDHVSYDSSPPGLVHAPPPYIAFSTLLI